MGSDDRIPVEEGTPRRLWAGNPMDWSYVDRALALIAVSLVALAACTVTLAVLPLTSLDHHLEPDIVLLAQTMNLASGIAWSIMFAVGYRRRRNQPGYPPFIPLYVLSWSIHFTVLLYLVGLYHTTFWLVIALGLVLSLLLLERSTVTAASVVGAVLVVLLTAAERLGLIPYGPMFREPPFERSGHPVGPWMWVLAITAVTLMLALWIVGDRLIERWREREESFRQLSIRDSLTGLPNRRHFLETLERECRRAERQGTPLSLLLCDADHFKRINDRYGHAAGDVVLRGIAEVLQKAVREALDMPGRVGGEEFAVILPDTGVPEAVRIAERIRRSARARTYNVGAEVIRQTLSIGVATYSDQVRAPDALLALADRMLYRAKNEGRDRTVAVEEPPSPRTSRPPAAEERSVEEGVRSG